MSEFTDRFKRVSSKDPKKHYIDTSTGETVTYRTALNRAKAGGIARKSHTPERVAKSTEAARKSRQAKAEAAEAFSKSWNKKHKKKITPKEAKSNPLFMMLEHVKKGDLKDFKIELPKGFKTFDEAAKYYDRALKMNKGRYGKVDNSGRSRGKSRKTRRSSAPRRVSGVNFMKAA